jgi:hypothetical protein
MAVAFANGALRELLLSPPLGGKSGHVLSTVILCGAIALIAWISMPWIGARTAAESWKVGGLWLALTLAFEFLAGHFLFGNSWTKLLADYNIAKGRVWVLVPIITLLAPRWAATVGRT